MQAAKAPVVVIGAGIVGMAAAIELQRRGRDVVVCDPAEPGSGASFGNAGCLNPSSIMPVSTPGVIWNVPKWLLDPEGPLVLRWRYLPLMAPWLLRFVRAGSEARVRDQARALHRLVDGAVEAMQSLCRDTMASPMVQHQGGLIVYRSEAAFAADTLAIALRRELGISSIDLDAGDLRQREPHLSEDHIRARLFPGNGHVTDPGRLVAALAEAFTRRGGSFVRARAVGFTFDGDGLSGVVTDSVTLPASAVVLAAGAHSRQLASRLGDNVPLDTERGYHVMLPGTDVGPILPTMSGEARIVATPMTGGLRIAGTVELAGVNAPPRWERADRLVSIAHSLYPALRTSKGGGEQVSRWLGFRPSLPDSLPVIGRSHRATNAIYAFGHGHVGLTAGARTGQIVADLVTGAPVGIDLEPYSARRF
jgi:D-amino-acid dehydrogenase